VYDVLKVSEPNLKGVVFVVIFVVGFWSDWIVLLGREGRGCEEVESKGRGVGKTSGRSRDIFLCDDPE